LSSVERASLGFASVKGHPRQRWRIYTHQGGHVESPTSRGLKFGAILGGVIAGLAIVRALAESVIDASLDFNQSGEALSNAIHTSGMLRSIVTGVLCAAVVMGLVLSPLWKRGKNHVVIAAGVSAVLVLNAVFFISGLSFIVAVIALGAAFAIGTSRLITVESGSATRLGVSLGAICTMAICSFVPAFVVGRGAVGTVAAAFLGTLITTEPILWALLRAKVIEQAPSPVMVPRT
jgi:hypothetical protein